MVCRVQSIGHSANKLFAEAAKKTLGKRGKKHSAMFDTRQTRKKHLAKLGTRQRACVKLRLLKEVLLTEKKTRRIMLRRS